MKSFRYAVHGLIAAMRSEKNLRFHLAAAVLATAAGIWFQVKTYEWLLLIVSITLVISFELINTALEELCNAVTQERNVFIKKAKDIAAAGVLITACGSASCGLVIFLPKIILLINS